MGVRSIALLKGGKSRGKGGARQAPRNAVRWAGDKSFRAPDARRRRARRDVRQAGAPVEPRPASITNRQVDAAAAAIRKDNDSTVQRVRLEPRLLGARRRRTGAHYPSIESLPPG